MGTAPDVRTLTTALDDLERRTILMQQARRTPLSWSDLPTLVLLAATLYLFFSAHDGVSSSTLALVMAVLMLNAWDTRRLSARVDAIVKLLARTVDA
jgi:hypothetical protein